MNCLIETDILRVMSIMEGSVRQKMEELRECHESIFRAVVIIKAK